MAQSIPTSNMNEVLAKHFGADKACEAYLARVYTVEAGFVKYHVDPQCVRRGNATSPCNAAVAAELDVLLERAPHKKLLLGSITHGICEHLRDAPPGWEIRVCGAKYIVRAVVRESDVHIMYKGNAQAFVSREALMKRVRDAERHRRALTVVFGDLIYTVRFNNEESAP